MLSLWELFCVSLLHYFVCGSIVRNQPSIFYGITKVPRELPVSTPPSTDCAPEKSLNSISDIKVMIDHVYNEKSLDKIIKDNYQSIAEEIRDKHLQDLKEFTTWFDNQPEHLKHVLQRLDKLRKERVEPVVETVSGVLAEYPQLERSLTEKNDKAKELVKRLNRYNMICKINCEDQQIEEHNISKRNVQDEFYCSSLEDLYREITEKLDESVKKFNNATFNNLSLDDEKYKEKIDEIKSKLKNEALKGFGRTMYDILSLEDEYHHFMDDVTSVDLHAAIYNIKSLGLAVDTKLLQLEQAVEKFGQHCNSCGSKTVIRNARQADLESEVKTTEESPVNELIEIKFDEITADVQNDLKNIFNDLNTLIQEAELENESFEKLIPIQEEINTLTNNEKEALNQLKSLKLNPIITNIIIKVLKELEKLLNMIIDILSNLPTAK